jgi:hypothetical protein
MPAPFASDFSVLCLCGGATTAVCAPGAVQYKVRAHRSGPDAPQRRECGVCHGTGRIHRDHGPRRAPALDESDVVFLGTTRAAYLSAQRGA